MPIGCGLPYGKSMKPVSAKRLDRLSRWMMHSRLTPMKDFVRLVRGYCNKILNYFKYMYTNAVIKGMNSVIQNLKESLIK
uniref:transposase n=1 Tax=Selenomonas sp. TAMA-11512 TaxID=3095337 RepID=UPI00403F6FF8